MTDQKRVYPRAMVRLPAEIEAKGASGWQKVLLHDLSPSGAAVHTRCSLPLQLEVRIRFRLPEEREGEGTVVEVACLVVRSGALMASDAGFAFFAGLHFLTLRGESSERVRAFVWACLEEASPN